MPPLVPRAPGDRADTPAALAGPAPVVADPAQGPAPVAPLGEHLAPATEAAPAAEPVADTRVVPVAVPVAVPVVAVPAVVPEAAEGPVSAVGAPTSADRVVAVATSKSSSRRN